MVTNDSADEEPRIRQLLIAARAGLEPWVSTPAEKLTEVARQCGAAEIAEAVAEIDALSRARATVPTWDGDALDGIGQAQETWTRILGQVDRSLLPEVARGLQGGEAERRQWVVLAVELHGAPAIPILRRALRGGGGRGGAS